MAIINFSKADAKRVLEACVERDKALTFVKDHGVYIMCFGKEAADNVIAYGRGYNPERDEHWYEKAYDVCGGDDFGQDLGSPDWFSKILAAESRWTNFRVHVTQNYLKLSVK